MSKFNVLIIGPEGVNALQEVLEPYYEHLKFPPYIKFTREDISRERKELIKEYKNSTDPEKQEKLVELQRMTDEEYFEHCTRFYSNAVLNTAGEPISTYNPNARWNDWDFAKLLASRKDGGYVPFARKKDIRWNMMEQYQHDKALVDWIRLKNLKDDQKKLLYDWEQGETKEQYIARKSVFLTPAYILRGKWYERGSIGWWGEIKNGIPIDKWIKQYRKMLTQIKPDTLLTTITCNI